MSACLFCTSARVLESGARAGALWCFVKRSAVGPSNACHSFTANADSIPAAGWDHELVKSDPKAHFDPLTHQKTRHAGF